MRLKTLEIKGFKSFANKTTIHFSEPMIGIVGPNGSGKSNIVDSIRWVLGEQKGKALRLESMGDVIFNGTKTRKKGNVAQVTLSFENTKNILPTEYSEVSISRILYASGESEYRLNDVKCRLKDITNLFMDSGIGSNSYAIIELAMVNDILTDENNARRKMFEQAAGISKFKIRKHETLNKLKLTEADLDRVEDLLFELETNMKGLEKQAKRTERYFALKEKYKQIQIVASRTKLAELKEKSQNLRTQLAEAKDKKLHLQTQLRNEQAALEKAQSESIGLEQALSSNQKETNQLFEQIRNLENDIKVRQQKVELFERNQMQLKEQIRNYESQLNHYEQRKAELELQGSERNEAEQGLLSEMQSAKTQLETFQGQFDEIHKEIDSENAAFDEVTRLKFDLEKDIAILKNSLQTETQAREGRQLEIQQLKSDRDGKQSLFDKMSNDKSKLVTELDAVRSKQGKALTALREMQEERDGLKEQLELNQRSLDKKQNEFNLMKSMVDSMEGFPASVKFLYDHYKGKLPMLSEAFECEPKYRDAVERFIEPYINHFIAETEKAAFDAIELLRNGQKGRAKFFVLSKFTQKLAAPASKDGLTAVLDVIKYDSKYHPLMVHLFGDAYLSDEQTQRSDDAVIINTTGNWVMTPYTISGGSKGLFEGKKIGRKKILQSLEKEILQIEKQIAKETSALEVIEKKIEANPALEMEEQLRQKELALDRLDFQMSSLEQGLESANSVVGEKEAVFTDKEAAISRFELGIKDNEKKLKTIAVSFAEAEAKIKDRSDALAKAQLTLNGYQEAFNAKNVAYLQAQNVSNLTKSELANLGENISRLTNSIGQDKNQIGNLDAEIAEVKSALHANETDLKALLQNKTDQASALNKAEETYFAKRGEVHELEKSIRELNSQSMQTQSLENEIGEKVHTFSFQEKEVHNRMQIEFNLDSKELQEFEVTEDFSKVENVGMEAEKLRNRLANYGDINPMAITAYEEIKERYDYIVSQRDDILYAQEDLQKTIKEIEETATQRYLDAFTQVKENFQVTFRTLFTEDDDCDLILLDEENPLDSKIEIIAKPKGKRPKSLSQLSGGEKTLTATALLFSLYLLKPAPFCILDEVDAPLDDRNVDKFTNLIRRFSDNSQFILITHNKATMRDVDVLYGVYMQEVGVSEMSAVDFRDKESVKQYDALVN